VIHGRVFDGENGQPLPRALVIGDVLNGASWAATTDDEGRYELKDLPAGRYSIVAIKGGYVPLAYGQTRPASFPAWSLDILEGQALDKIDISLPRGGVNLRTSGPDQDGRFKVSGLPPGDYQIVAVDAIEPGQWMDPEFLNQIKGDATAFSLNEGETKVMDLKQIAHAR
jgi:hypothetical protein